MTVTIEARECKAGGRVFTYTPRKATVEKTRAVAERCTADPSLVEDAVRELLHKGLCRKLKCQFLHDDHELLRSRNLLPSEWHGRRADPAPDQPFGWNVWGPRLHVRETLT